MYQIKEQLLDSLIDKINGIILNAIEKQNNRLNHLKESYILNNPSKLFENRNHILNKYIEKLEVLNPLNTLKRGYTIVKKDNKAIDDIKKLKLNDSINIIFNKGTATANIVDIKEN
jgi:exodeoxyribonuclease VII large subunit